MAISKEALKIAMREAVSAEFAHIPTDESAIEHTFSAKFEKKMNKLLKAQKNSYWHFYNTASKRVAIVFAVLVMLVTTACSVEEIREPIVKFIKKVYETFVEYSYEGDTVGVITKKYEIKELPEGFVQTQYLESEASISITYENENGDMVIFYQNITKGASFSWDNEQGKIYSKRIGSLDVEIYESDVVKQAFWIQDGYSFGIACLGTLEMELLEFLILQVE